MEDETTYRLAKIAWKSQQDAIKHTNNMANSETEAREILALRLGIELHAFEELYPDMMPLIESGKQVGVDLRKRKYDMYRNE